MTASAASICPSIKFKYFPLEIIFKQQQLNDAFICSVSSRGTDRFSPFTYSIVNKSGMVLLDSSLADPRDCETGKYWTYNNLSTNLDTWCRQSHLN